MKKILISPIGRRDPRSPDGKKGPALTICHYLEPHIVYLLPTAKRLDARDNTCDNSLKTEEEIKRFNASTKVCTRKFDVSDPTDFAQVLPQLRGILSGVLKETESYAQREFYFNASSATPQIQAACLLAVASGILPARALSVVDPGHATDDQRVRDVPVTLLQEDGMLDKISGLYNKLMFNACIEELKSLEQLTQSRPRRDAAETWRLLCEGYSTLDRLNYAEAYQSISRVRDKTKGTHEAQPISSILNEQLSVLDHLRQGDMKEDELVLSDIYHNAQRRFTQGAFADALARVWRLLEGGMFYYLRENYGIEPSSLEQSPCLKSSETDSLAQSVVNKLIQQDKKYLSFESSCVPKGAKDKKRRKKQDEKYLSFENSRVTLKEDLRDQPFRSFLVKKVTISGKQKELGGMMEGLRQKRNNSVAAHGTKAVEAETAQNGLELTQEFLRFLFPQLALPDYPFSQEKLTALGESLRQITGMA